MNLDKFDLLQTFSARLISQDRMNVKRDANISFGTISKICTHKDGYTKGDNVINRWKKRLLNKIILLVKNGDGKIDEVKLSELDYITIPDKLGKPVTAVYFSRKSRGVVQTRTADRKSFIDMYAFDLSAMEIDHEPAIDTVLRENALDTPALCILSDIMKEFASKYGLDFVANSTKLENLVVNDSDARRTIEAMLPEIENELEFLDEKFRLEIMSATENKEKSNSIDLDSIPDL